jgi:hypothetical protein
VPAFTREPSSYKRFSRIPEHAPGSLFLSSLQSGPIFKIHCKITTFQRNYINFWRGIYAWTSILSLACRTQAVTIIKDKLIASALAARRENNCDICDDRVVDRDEEKPEEYIEILSYK